MKDFKELEEKYKDCLTEDVIKHYSLKYNLNREEAKKKLINDFENEAEEVNPRVIALKAMKGIRVLSSQIIGVVEREKDLTHRVQKLEGQLSYVMNIVDDLKNKVEENTDVFKKTVTLLMESINKHKKQSLLKRIWNKIKWIFLKH